ncbi:hypothetical protein DRW03_04450 [Corallococcus sp. H22C18031201]|uniref:hypothetical protein n=1 Tax=Citreicoccus inhibens TaxID=2849499 RepID=UPI000E72167E|nr:hypothetical protein [Citreicoccus inhibens]MBU8899253.1 hypothetical protein [Citreicoccus inhibens]RJS25738.1 hypothetical protein DRW03_04450 [Corallococcus sp. H22C18031201]
MPSRWDHLFDLKPVALIDHLLDEVAKLLAKDLQTWPPPVQELDLDTGGAFASLFTEPRPRPAAAVYTEALRLTRWELTREFDALDEYVRNKRYLERGLVSEDRLPLLFLSRWLTEQMLGLGEATEGRVKRAHMQNCLERLEARLRQATIQA